MKGVLCVLLLIAVALGEKWTRFAPHIVPNGTSISKNETHVSFVHPDGFEQIFPRVKAGTKMAARAQSTTASGWVSSLWSWGNSYTYFTGQWTVPPAPTNNNGQIIFFFNSFEGATSGGSGSDILQPVLQFNNGVSGWTLASWYGDSNGYTESTPVGVNVGDTITGVIKLSNGQWNVLGYVNGAQKTSLTIAQSAFQGGDNQNTAQWALEVYSMSTCDQYPPSNSLTLSNIGIQDNNNWITPSWSTPSPNSAACQASGYVTSSSQVTITWQSGSSSSSGQSTSGCGSGLLWCPNAGGGAGQCYSSSQYVCSGNNPYLCPTSAPYACSGACNPNPC